MTALTMLADHLDITMPEMEQRLIHFMTRVNCPGCHREIARRIDDVVRYHRTPEGHPCQASGTFLAATLDEWQATS
ncbi:hypothetical protein [Nonomuraea candida]|uniref:hypothetical protein n=1 Tax=Nonomuraea candida TaxID=359159 RepID=UPI0005BA58CF|nr:hypothetical protein [Nonomuraea candida]